jgi:hypothetical protein
LIGTIRITDDVCIAEHPFGAAILSEIKITMTKKLFIIAGVVGALSLTAFASAPKKDIVDTAVGAGSFKTLVKLVQAAELVETLKGTFHSFRSIRYRIQEGSKGNSRQAW